uniref:NADH dehydrogenase subunit 4 n=1 Tax=Platystethus dilutipennis TaxID=3078934 RepID=UPI002A81A3EE|nr:NADH dehydrogenase subunit 4 [Platystethus dilutipennis]WON66103.1 NADH dehydrogenase subunit 4 [Platystethus dilutipennis]
MMKLIMIMIFMIPLNFNLFWFNQLLYFYFMLIFILNFNWMNYYSMISFSFGIDLMGFFMILLSIWICSLMILASNKMKTMMNFKLFLMVINILLLTLIMTFSTLNLFMFYMFFEMSLIPTLILILGWGYQPERIQAGIYLLFYTLLASLPMLVGIFNFYKCYQSLDFNLMNIYLTNYYMYLSFNIVFLVKFPMYFFHLWLPKAHVEAPISGSMILAGIMLKLGGYGMIRLMAMFQVIGMKFNYLWMLNSMIGGCLISLICLRQSDMKSLIAYSSVAHMSLVISGVMTMNYWGLIGALIMMIAHGLCSSGMFCLVNISYERVMSRSLFLNKGMINLMPSMSLWWFLLCSSSMAAPPSLNLLSEIMLLSSLISWSKILMIMLMIMSFLSAGYSLFLYSYSQHGKFYSGVYSFSLGSIREFLLLFLHWFPLNILILKSDLLVWI